MSKRMSTNALTLSLAVLLSSFFALSQTSIGQEKTKKEQEKYVWKTVSGKVVDEDGEPIKDAYVCHDNLNHHPMNHTSTNEKGEFKLKYRESTKDLEKGWLWAYSPDHNLRCVTNSRTDNHKLVLPKYTEFKITFLQPDKKPLKQASIRPLRCYIPNGKYSDAESNPRLGGILPNALGEKLATKTDDDGQCVIRNIPRALWGRVVIESKNHGKHILGGGTKNDSFQIAKTGSLKIEILPDEPVEFSDTEVSIHSWGRAGENWLEGKIGGLGICRFEHVIPGDNIKVSLKIGKDEIYQPKLKENYNVETGLETHIKIPIKKTVLVSGEVLADGEPVPNAMLMVGELERISRTDENGKFKTRVFPGSLKIKVYDMPRKLYADFETGNTRHFQIKDTDKPVTIDSIELPSLTSVTVEVIDENNKPVTGFKVYSIYEGRGYGPFSKSKLDKNGTTIVKLMSRALNSLDEASFFLIPDNTKDDEQPKEESKIKLSV